MMAPRWLGAIMASCQPPKDSFSPMVRASDTDSLEQKGGLGDQKSVEDSVVGTDSMCDHGQVTVLYLGFVRRMKEFW